MTAHDLPTLNACLNGLSGILLFLGWLAIKNGRKDIHQKFMVSALISSTLFLISYLTYHTLVHGVTRYQKEGISKIVYLFILATHTPLAAIIVPFSLIALRHAIKGRFDKHTRITRWLMPVWMYVSVTGVVIYLMLYTFKGRGF